MAIDKEESYAVFAMEDWRSPFVDTWQMGSCYRSMEKDISLRSWQPTISYTKEFSLRKGTTEIHYGA